MVNQDRSWNRILDKNYCNDNNCKLINNCISENVIIILSICLLCIIILLFINNFLLYTHNNLNIYINIAFIILAIILIIITIISPILNSCPNISTINYPNNLKPNVITIVFNDILSLNDAKNIICNAINICNDPNTIYIYAYRTLNNQTLLSFKTEYNINTDDITLSNKIIYINSEIPNITPSVKLQIINFNTYTEPSLPNTLIPSNDNTDNTNIPITLPSNIITSEPDDNIYEVCRDYIGWNDIYGNNCTYYNTHTLCNTIGIESNYSNNNQSYINCNNINTQNECLSHKSNNNNNICIWNDNICTNAYITAYDACCMCGGGYLESLSIPPTSNIPIETTSPIETTIPVTIEPIETTIPITMEPALWVLGIKGLSNFDTLGFSDWIVPLYYYVLTDYPVTEDDISTIENTFMGKYPVKSSNNIPIFNIDTGKFDSMPNVIISVTADKIEVPDGIELKTEEIPGMIGFYYLYIKSPYCNKYLPLYTQPISTLTKGYQQNYFTLVDPNGNPMDKSLMLSCNNIDYSCMCNESNGNLDLNARKTFKYEDIPDILYKNCPGKSFEINFNNDIEEEISKTKHPYDSQYKTIPSTSCRLTFDMDIIKLNTYFSPNNNNINFSQLLFPDIPNTYEPGTINNTFTGELAYYGFNNIDDINNICPNELNAVKNDPVSLNTLNIIQQKSNTINNIINTQSMNKAMTEIYNNMSTSQSFNDTEELYNLRKCIIDNNNNIYNDKFGTCEFLKDYYKYCKTDSDEFDNIAILTQLMDNNFNIDNDYNVNFNPNTMFSAGTAFYNLLIRNPICLKTMLTNNKNYGIAMNTMMDKLRIGIISGDINPNDPNSIKQYFSNIDNLSPRSPTDWIQSTFNAYDQVENQCCGISKDNNLPNIINNKVICENNLDTNDNNIKSAIICVIL